MISLILFIAAATPLPPKRLSLSLSSHASNFPVDAPEGTDASPFVPSEKHISQKTVGVPLESIISCPLTLTIFKLKSNYSYYYNEY